VRKVFSWFQSDGRYSSQNKFPAFTGELPNGDQFYGFPSEKDALKIGKHNGGQVISHLKSVNLLALTRGWF
jgi:N-methyl-L-tryptophan oxidase